MLAAHPAVTSTPPPSASTARILVILALVFQAMFPAIIVLILGVVILTPFPGSVGNPSGPPLNFWPFPGFLFLLFGGAIALAVIFLILGYLLVLVRIRDGNYEGARVPALVLGILGILLSLSGGFLSGILYIIAYVKLGDAVQEARGFGWGPPVAAWPGYPGSPGYAPAAACPHCGSPLAFVPQYGRYYCPREGRYP